LKCFSSSNALAYRWSKKDLIEPASDLAFIVRKREEGILVAPYEFCGGAYTIKNFTIVIYRSL